MKDKLLKLLASKEEKRKQLAEKAKTTENVNELRSINSEIESLNIEIAELRGMVEALPEDPEGTHFVPSGEQRQAQPPVQVPTGFNPVATFSTQQRSGVDASEVEYRQAFMDYVLKGTAIPEELRANATTKTADIGAVIPNTIINKIVEKLNTYGHIFARVTKTNIKGGVSVPTSSAKPVASWVGEGTVSEKQKKVTGEVTFAYHKLQCRVAVSLEADTTSLAVFEQTVINNVYEAMIIALEGSIISGTGTGQPKGIIKHNGAGVKTFDFAADTITKYPTWVEAMAKLALAYRGKGVMTLTATDWDKYLVGMVDTNGQPIARVTYGLEGRPSYRFNGMEVELVDDYLETFDAAAANGIFGFIVDYSDYLLNSNLQLTVKRYFDEDTDEWITKATLLADGKMVSTESLVLFKKKTA